MKKLIIILIIILIVVLTIYCFCSLTLRRTPQEGEQTTFTPLPIEVHTGEVKTVTEPYKVLLGTYTIYAYCPCVKCCGKTNGITASGTIATEGRTAASTLPFSTKLYIDGIGERLVEDRGGGIKGNKIDLYMDSHETALQHGVKRLEVWELRE